MTKNILLIIQLFMIIANIPTSTNAKDSLCDILNMDCLCKKLDADEIDLPRNIVTQINSLCNGGDDELYKGKNIPVDEAERVDQDNREQMLEKVQGVINTAAVPKISMEFLQGGLSNNPYLVVFDSGQKKESYVLRSFPKNRNKAKLSREDECKIQLLAHKIGVGPGAIVYGHEKRLAVRFIDGSPFSEEKFISRSNNKGVLKKLKQLHDKSVMYDYRKLNLNPRSIVDSIKNNYQQALDEGVLFPDNFDEALEVMEKIEKVTAPLRKLSLCHNDVHAGNIINSRDGTDINLIDWEFASIGDPFSDLADWVNKLHLQLLNGISTGLITMSQLKEDYGLEHDGKSFSEISSELHEKLIAVVLDDYLEFVNEVDVARLYVSSLLKYLDDVVWRFLQSKISKEKRDWEEEGKESFAKFKKGVSLSLFEKRMEILQQGNQVKAQEASNIMGAISSLMDRLWSVIHTNSPNLSYDFSAEDEIINICTVRWKIVDEES